MARAKRHYIPGQVWHLTHRCHKREFLLKFARDKRRFLQWLFEAKRRYGLTMLNYAVTSNHIHLVVVDDGDRDTIARSIQLVAGRCAQEYNERKKRKANSTNPNSQFSNSPILWYLIRLSTCSVRVCD